MEQKRYEEIDVHVMTITYYLFAGDFFDEFSEEDKVVFRGYARMGKKYFDENISLQKLFDQFEVGVKKDFNLEYLRDTFEGSGMDQVKEVLYYYMLTEPGQEKEALQNYLSGVDFDQLRKQTIASIPKVNIERINITQEIEVMIKNIDDLSKNHIIFRTARFGIKNKYFTKDELIEYYEILMSRFFKPQSE